MHTDMSPVQQWGWRTAGLQPALSDPSHSRIPPPGSSSCCPPCCLHTERCSELTQLLPGRLCICFNNHGRVCVCVCMCYLHGTCRCVWCPQVLCCPQPWCRWTVQHESFPPCRDSDSRSGPACRRPHHCSPGGKKILRFIKTQTFTLAFFPEHKLKAVLLTVTVQAVVLFLTQKWRIWGLLLLFLSLRENVKLTSAKTNPQSNGWHSRPSLMAATEAGPQR